MAMELERRYPWFLSPSYCAVVSLVAMAASFATVPTVGEEVSPPEKFTVASDARPIWSPTRPLKPVAATAGQSSEKASTLRFVQEGWGSDTAVVEPNDSSVVLRWRSRKPDNAFQDADSGTPVRAVSHDEAASPFDDPFGDKLVQNADPQMKLPTSEPPMPKRDSAFEPDLESLPPSTDLSKEPSGLPPEQMELPVEPAPVDPTEPSTEPGEPAEAPRGLPLEEPMPPERVGPAESEPSAPSLELPREFESPVPPPVEDTETPENPLRRIYNERDCCEEELKCKTARLALRQNSIKSISLDITASYMPEAESVEEEQKVRDDRLRLMPARKWRNRAGQVVAEGRLTDLRHRRAVIAQSNGSVSEIRLGELSDDDLCFLAAWWRLPTECTLGDDQFAYRQWEPVTFAWKASALCHKPLLFEEVQLERYGHTTGPIFQPVLSSAHFFLNVAVMPYKMGMNPPNECQYALGYYRPGSCAPWLLPPAPLSVRGGLMQAGAITGLIFLVP